MSIYQFLIAVRQQDGQQLMNEAGETTSHLMGLFYRCADCCSLLSLSGLTADPAL